MVIADFFKTNLPVRTAWRRTKSACLVSERGTSAYLSTTTHPQHLPDWSEQFLSAQPVFFFFRALMETKGKEQINRNFHWPSVVCLAHLSGPRQAESSGRIPTHGRPTVDEV